MMLLVKNIQENLLRPVRRSREHILGTKIDIEKVWSSNSFK